MRLIFSFLILSLAFVGQAFAGAKPASIIETVRVDPLMFNAATGLTVEPVLVDGATGYTFEYRWYLNGDELFFETSEHIPGKLLKRDDEVKLEVTPVDGAGNKFKPFVSLPLKAVNVSPAIDSEPPAKFGNKEFHYQVVASDLDGDRLSYRLEEAPAGMAIDSLTGELKWSYETMPEGVFDVLIIVEDAFGGRAEQNFELNLSFVKKRIAE